MRTLLLISLLLALIVVAVREPGEGYPEAALRLVSEASDAATGMVAGKIVEPDRAAPPTPEAVTTQQPPGSEPATSATEPRPPVIGQTPPPERQAGTAPSPPPTENAPAITRPAPATPRDGVTPGHERSDDLPEFLPPGPEGDRAGGDVGRASSRALYREATRLLEAIDR